MIDPQIDLFLPDAWDMPVWFHECGFSRNTIIRNLLTTRGGYIRQSEDDGTPQLGPILFALGTTAADARRRYGKAIWRKVHHSELIDNARRGFIMLTCAIPLETALLFPPSALREIPNMVSYRGKTAVMVAATIVKTRAELRQAVPLVADTLRMGGDVKAGWSMRRLCEEHDRLAREYAIRFADPKPFCEPYSAEVDGYFFTRLTSAMDFRIEGAEMCHCIGGYASYAKKGQEVAFRISGKERASVSFSNTGHIELKGRYNAAVSAACSRAAGKMWKQFCAEGRNP